MRAISFSLKANTLISCYKICQSSLIRTDSIKDGSHGSSDWTGLSGFDPRQRQEDLSSSLCVQTGSEAHQASCTMGTGGPFPSGKARPVRDADHSPHLVSRWGMSRSYTPSPPSASVDVVGLLYFTSIKGVGVFTILNFASVINLTV
jgi:hypothetical protein